MTLYDVLGVPPTASHAELRRAFLRMAWTVHPDVHATADPATRRVAEARMRCLNEVWTVLGRPERRRSYDLHLAEWSARAGQAPFSPSFSHPGMGWYVWLAAPPSAAGPQPTPRPVGAEPERTLLGAEQRGLVAAPVTAASEEKSSEERSLLARALLMSPGACLALAVVLVVAGGLLRAPAVASAAAVSAALCVVACAVSPVLAVRLDRRGVARQLRGIAPGQPGGDCQVGSGAEPAGAEPEVALVSVG